MNMSNSNLLNPNESKANSNSDESEDEGGAGVPKLNAPGQMQGGLGG